MESPPLTALIEALADRYAIEREVGRGGMATVFLARDLKHHRPVAIKVLNPELGAVLGVERFLAEIRVTANLQHPNILPLFDSGESGGLLYYVMPYVEGETLRARLEREHQLPVDEAVRLTVAIAGALDHAHGNGVIHRDLKPENILLQAGQPVLADFGIALAVSNAGGARVTQTGLSLGTPQYMSPEQASGERGLDARSDQFSLASVLYEMLAGETPHSGGTAQVIIARLLTETPRPLQSTRPSVPPAVNGAVARALSKAPADRFATTRAFAEALSIVERPRALRRRPWVAIAGVAVLGVVAATAYFAGRSATPALDATTVIVIPTNAGDDAALAASVDDAVAEGIGRLGWVQLRTAAGGASSDEQAATAARKVGAATAAMASVQVVGDSVQLRSRLVDAATATVIRQLPAMMIARHPSVPSLRAAAEPLAVAVGFVTHPALGAVAIPGRQMPRLDAFRELAGSVDFSDRTDVRTARLQRALALDSTFLQAKLWLGFTYGYGYSIGRMPGGAARADTVERWVENALSQGTPYEVALAGVTRASYGEVGDAAVEAIRQLLALAPQSPMARLLPELLLDVNRPREAIEAWRALLEPRDASDSLPTVRAAGTWLQVSEVWHSIGQYDSSLVAARKAKIRRPDDLLILGSELNALAALGRLDEMQRLLADVSQASRNGQGFGFGGNIYLTLANELRAHGHAAEGRAVAERAETWFRQNTAEATRDLNMVVRWALALMTLDRKPEAERLLRDAIARDTSDVRLRGLLARIYVDQGRLTEARPLVRWLEDRPAEKLQGTATYERAAITAHLGREHWDEAVNLLSLSLQQGQGFNIRRRLHYFEDWLPLRDFPPFQRVLAPRG